MKKVYKVIISIIMMLSILSVAKIVKADTENASSISIDGVYITSKAGEYKTGDKITFEVRFSENIKKAPNGSLPFLHIKIGENTRNMITSEENISR